MIQRYDPSGSMYETEDGHFVEYEDYKKLLKVLRKIYKSGNIKEIEQIAKQVLEKAGSEK